MADEKNERITTQKQGNITEIVRTTVLLNDVSRDIQRSEEIILVLHTTHTARKQRRQNI